MDQQPRIIFETERLIFREPVIADLDAFCAMEADPDVRRFVGGYPRSREAAEQRFLVGLGKITGDLTMWSAIYKLENKYVGRCGIYPHFDDNGQPIPGEAALGLYVAKDYWGRGLATEAAAAFINFGFNQLHIKRIIATIQVGNDASVRVMEKFGFQLERIEEGPRSFYHYELINPNLISNLQSTSL